jgi:hypothetical protein
MNKKTAVTQHSLKIALACAFALGATALSGTASAASAPANASATVVTPITITKATDLSFGNIAAGGTAGTVKVDTNGTRSVTGGTVAVLGGTATAAKFDLTGSGNLGYAISYAPSITLTSGANTMTVAQVSDLNAAGGASATVATGALVAGIGTLYIGGTLTVAANQPAGSYTGVFSTSVDDN